MNSSLFDWASLIATGSIAWGPPALIFVVLAVALLRDAIPRPGGPRRRLHPRGRR